MPRRLAHFSDPRLDSQVEELIKHGNSTRETADKHASRRDNPHKVTPEQIGAETAAGAQAKIDTHATATTGVHGVGASEVESKAGAQAKVDAHAGRTDNPHAVTAAQVGAVAKAGDTMTGTLILPTSGLVVGPTATPQLRAISFDLVFAAHDQTTRGDSGLSRLAVKVLYNSQAAIVLNYGNDFPGGVHIGVLGNTVWHAGNDGAGSGLDAGLLEGKRWVTVASGSASVAATASVSISLRSGGAHHHYLVSVYNPDRYTRQHLGHTAGACSWHLLQCQAGYTDTLYLHNGADTSTTFYYSVLAWE